jgi:peptide/nickel transport system permease protein
METLSTPKYRKEKVSLSFTLRKTWKKNPTLIIGSILVIAVVLLGIFGNYFAPFDPIETNYKARLLSPSSLHIFGTDKFGRDVFSRVLVGTRIDLLIGVICTIVPLLIGTIIGLISGYSGGVIDNILMRIVDITVSFPYLVLVIMILAILGSGTKNLFLALIITDWISYAKIVRGEVLVAKNSEYILAAKALGFNPLRILTKHLLPNTISPAIIFAMSSIVMCILSAASLGYLGLGVQPPTPEWGVMIADGREFVTDAAWISIFPGLTIAVVGISFALFGDGLSSLLRPTDR